jgi:hypothetical protein
MSQQSPQRWEFRLTRRNDGSPQDRRRSFKTETGSRPWANTAPWNFHHRHYEPEHSSRQRHSGEFPFRIFRRRNAALTRINPGFRPKFCDKLPATRNIKQSFRSRRSTDILATNRAASIRLFVRFRGISDGWRKRQRCNSIAQPSDSSVGTTPKSAGKNDWTQIHRTRASPLRGGIADSSAQPITGIGG